MRGPFSAFGARGAHAALATALLLLPLAGCRRASAEVETDQGAERIFANVCSRCHGVDGKGGLASGAANAPRNFCDSAFQANRTDAELKQVIRQGKGGMPAFGDLFSDADLTGLVHKLRSFDPKGH
jgi:mono/diheme cytochrome c family protein